MFKAKSIDELYDEVKNFDLVMCNDAPLALALNNRLDKPHIGVFAITPRQLAVDLSMDILEGPMESDIEVVKKLSELYDSPMRFVHGEVENFKTIRKYTPNVKKYLKGWRSKNLYDEYVNYNTLEKAMSMSSKELESFFKGKNIAIIGLDLYDELDKLFNPAPDNFEEIDLFKEWDEKSFVIPEFRELYNDHQMAENAVSLIEKENAADFAIVLDVNGKIADAVRSELYRKGLPFINDLSMRDLNNIRDYIEFINRSLNFSICKVSQVRELLRSYHGSIISKYDDYLIADNNEIIKDDRTRKLVEIMKNIRKRTYGAVCNEVVDKKDSAQINMLLKQLDLTNKEVNTADTADMVYAVNNFELKHNEQILNSEKEGVLLVDCKNSVYVDRPVVIYLGLGPEWEKDLSDLNLIDYKLKDDIIEKNVTKFQILLQQGTSRIYICNSMKDGKKNKPCIYFEKSQRPEKPYESFSDIAKCVPGPWEKYEEREHIEVGIENVTADLKDFQFSSSSYDQFISCPMRFMFGSVIKSPDGEHTALGSYLHQYAEFRCAFPEKAKELGPEYFVQDISKNCMPLFSPEVRSLRESKIRSAISELDWLIDNYGLSEGVKIIKKDRKHENVYFSLVDADGNGSDSNEVKLIVRERHMNGTLDVIKGNQVFDFKTGRPKTPSGIKESMNLSKPSDYGKDMQCLFYLSLMMDSGIDKPSFTFYSTSANELNDTLGIERDTMAPFTNVVMMEDKKECFLSLFPRQLMAKGKGYEKMQDNCDLIVDTILEIGLDETVANHEDAIQIIADRIGINNNVTNGKNLNTLLNIVDKIVGNVHYSFGNTVYVTKEEMEAFRAKLAESYESVKEMYTTKFPAKPLMKCDKCDCKDLCVSASLGGDEDE